MKKVIYKKIIHLLQINYFFCKIVEQKKIHRVVDCVN